MQKVELTIINVENAFKGIWIKGDNHSIIKFLLKKVFWAKKNWTNSDLHSLSIS